MRWLLVPLLVFLAAPSTSAQEAPPQPLVFVDGEYEVSADELTDGPFARTDRVSVTEITLTVTVDSNTAAVFLASTSIVETPVPSGSLMVDGTMSETRGLCRETFLVLQTGFDVDVSNGIISVEELTQQSQIVIDEVGCFVQSIQDFRITNPPGASDGQTFPTTLDIVAFDGGEAVGVWGGEWTFLFEDMTAPASEAAEPEYGIVERDGNIFITSPPGEVLEISRADLPASIRFQLVAVGAFVAVVGPPDAVITGDSRVLLDGLPVVRVGDETRQGGTVATGSSTIFINGVPAAVLADSFVANPGADVVPRGGGPIISLGNGREFATDVCESEWGGLSRFGRSRGFNECLRNLELSVPTQVLESPAAAGTNELDIDSNAFDIGVELSIGNIAESAERAIVAGKGSIILDRKLKNSYPVGTAVVQVSGLGEVGAPVESPVSDGGSAEAEQVLVTTAEGDGSSLVVQMAVGVIVVLVGAGLVVSRGRKRQPKGD